MAGLDVRRTAQPSMRGGGLHPVVPRLELLPELLCVEGSYAHVTSKPGTMDLDLFPGHVALHAGEAWVCRSRSPDGAVTKGGEYLHRSAGGCGTDVAAPSAQAEAVCSDVGGGAIDGRLDVRRVEVGDGEEGDAIVADCDEPPDVHGRPGWLVRVDLRDFLSLDRSPLLR